MEDCVMMGYNRTEGNKTLWNDMSCELEFYALCKEKEPEPEPEDKCPEQQCPVQQCPEQQCPDCPVLTPVVCPEVKPTVCPTPPPVVKPVLELCPAAPA